MDIHRCRFVPYPASAINALAFSHPPCVGKSPPTLRLAIGRASGDIEIWNPRNGLWIQEIILRGGKDRSIEGLAWTHDLEGDEEAPDAQNQTLKTSKLASKLRLFSVGYSNSVTEWDLALGRPIRHSGGNYGEIWCMAAQPRWTKEERKGGIKDVRANQLLAVGCADGAIVLHSTSDSDLRFLQTLPRPSSMKARVLSLAFQGRTRIVAGYSDSAIRIFTTERKGKLLYSMSLGAGSKGGSREVLVWTVKCLDDGAIVSGDSTGEVKVWDSRTATLVQRIASHKADILDLVCSADGLNLMSSGIDRRTTLYHRSKFTSRWEESSHQKIHSGDVKAMATYESNGMSIVASGGNFRSSKWYTALANYFIQVLTLLR